MQIALKAGADAFGFLVGITHKAEDKVSYDEAKYMIAMLPPFVSSVAVTHLTDVREIIDVVKFIKASTLQIHDHIAPEAVGYVRDSLPNIKILKAIHVIDQETVGIAKSFERYVDGLLLDSRTKDRLGGTGITHDWSISREIVEAVKVPVILAGGLTPGNVFEAVKKVQPFGVDVNSGVEINGDKDFDSIKIFIREARKGIGK